MMQEQSIFVEALDKEDPAERAAFLARVCASDPVLRQRIERLLQQHQQGDSFLDSPVGGQVGTADEPQTERTGAVIGPYKLLQQIGEGGMGVVYMAEQQHPLRRKVALKIIKPGMDSAQVIARFEAERQALALMDHQNIAKVFDAGTTVSGRPYFVMELVHGVPITQYSDDHHLTPKERLELFLPVCHAIQHAHQKGIIHRDLKPSNVLVCLYDGVAVPKVIDFGIAKATGQQLTERTMFTQFGSLVGTLEYMSPEQAEMSQLGIDTRSDVYSMGVMLYELLTGTTPLERKRVREAGFDEIRRLIREEEPPKPSTRLSTSGVALAAISAQRQTEPAKLTRLVRGELDWIVMKALEKDRNRRYESANSLARDVERYLHDEPVEACPPTAGYRLRKFARKHMAGLATAVGFAALLVIGTAVSAWLAVLAQANENKANAHAAQAEQKQQEAKNERDQVRALNEKLQATQAELRSTLYASDMNLAQHAWEAGGAGQVRELSERHRPKAGETELRDFEWYYLYRLCHSDLLTLNGHTDLVLSVAYSPDGKRLASSSADKTVKVWDAQTGQQLFTIKGHRSWVNSVSFSPDGKRLASASADNTVKVWDAQTGQELLSLKIDCNSVAFSPDGKWLASADEDSTVKVRDAQTGQELISLKGHKERIRSVAYSPDGKRLASGGGRGEVGVWDAQTGQELLSLRGHTSQVNSMAFSPDGKRLASADGEVKVWDARTGQELLSLKIDCNSVVFSPDGKWLASADEDSTVKVWDAQTGQELLSLKGHTRVVACVAFSPDGKHLISASADQTVKIWDATTSPEVRSLSGHTAHVRAVAFSPDGKRLASAAEDKTVKVWDVQTDRELLALKGHTMIVTSVAFSPDGKRLASGQYCGPDRLTVKVWDAQTGQELLSLKGPAAPYTSVAFSPDGKRLASASWGGSQSNELKLWDVKTGQELLSIKGGAGEVAFSPDGRLLTSGTYGGRPVKVWDAQTGQELVSLKGPGGTCVAFSPDGRRLACGQFWGTVQVWDVQSRQSLLSFTGHPGHVGSVAFSPDGKRLVTLSGGDKMAKVWDAQTGQEVLTFKSSGGGVAFSPDGHRLAASDGHIVKLWDATPLPEKP
jgi:WD40 repeat protein/serine/threonine protein kinase